MKRKSILFTIFVLIFGFCGTLGYYNNFDSITNASSQNASVWNGETITNENELTESDWYSENGNDFYIRSASGFSYFAHAVSDGTIFRGKNIYLETDIDLANENWTPIGTVSNSFQGTFYGQGHTIYNLEINQASSTYLGLFGVLTDYSKINNLHLSNINIDLNITSSGNYYIGGLVGYFNNTGNIDRNYFNSYITRSSVEGTISVTANTPSQSYYVGGLAGAINNASVNISKSEVDIAIGDTDSLNAQNLYVGGITGSSDYLTMSDLYYDGIINVKSSVSYGYVGGFVGSLRGRSSTYTSAITNTYSKSDINLTNNGQSFYLGGIVGNVANQYFELKNSYHIGDIDAGNNNLSGTNSMGGLIGQISSASYNYTEIINCFNVGALSGNNYNQNYLYHIDSNIAESQRPKVAGLYFDVDKKSTEKGNLENQIVNLKEIAKTKDFYISERYWDKANEWDFSSDFANWDISSSLNGGYPYLTQVNNIGNANNDNDYSSGNKLDGEGTAESPYLIRTAGDLGYFSFNYESGKYYALQANIDLEGRSWQPIGTLKNPFKGVFDGNGYTIYGLTCSLQEQFSAHGLFGVTSNAIIKNLSIKDVKFINEGQESGYIGTFVGFAQGDTYLINCSDNEYGQEGTTLTNGTKVYSVGIVSTDANVYVFYGDNSINLSGMIVENNPDTTNNGDFYGNINLSGTKSSSNGVANIYYGYDLTINGNGGTFYSSAEEIYKGKYHLLVMPTGDNAKVKNVAKVSNEDVASKVVNVSGIDKSFGTSWPQLSHLFGKTDTIIKRGFIAETFKYSSGIVLLNLNTEQTSEVTNIGINYSKNPLAGINVGWRVYGFNASNPSVPNKNTAYQIKVIYNAYEKAEFNTETENYSSSSDVQIDENGYVYKIFYLEYDSFLSDYPEIFDIPTYTDVNGTEKLLRNGDFYIEGIYKNFEKTNVNTEGSFDTKIYNTEPADDEDSEDYYASKTLVNQTFATSKTGDVYLALLYANWKGVETVEDGHEFDLTISLNPFEATEGQEGFAGNFNIQDAVASIKVYQIADVNKTNFNEATLGTAYREFKKDSLIVSENKAKAVITISTTKLSDSINNCWYVSITLENGFVYAGNGTVDQNYNNVIDSNFGNAYVSGQQGSWKFFNLVDDYNLTMIISRKMSTNQLYIGNGVYMGLSPFEKNWSKVSVIGPNKEKADISSLTNNATLKEAYQNGENFIGFDFMRNKILSSSANYDAIDLPTNYISTDGSARSVLFEYEFAGENKYYLYEVEDNSGSSDSAILYTISLYESSLNRDKVDLVARLGYINDLQYELTYYSFTTFGFVFSTEIDASVFNKYTLFTDENVGQESFYIIMPSENPSKIAMTFENVITIFNEYKLEATTMYSQAIVSFNVKYLAQDQKLFDEDGNVNYVDLTENAPKIYRVTSNSLGGWDLGTELRSDIYEVDSDGKIVFAVESSDYYKFFINRGNANTAVLYNSIGGQNTENSCNLKVTVADEDDSTVSYYEENFNLSNSSYLNVESVNHSESRWLQNETGGLVNAKEFYVITLSYATGDDGLKAGAYTLDIICTDIFYNMSYATKFVGADVDVNALKDVNLLENEENSDITTQVMVNNATYNQKDSTIKFGDDISVSTAFGSNKGYLFWGWYISGLNYSRIIQKDASMVPEEVNSELEAVWKFSFGSRYSATSGTNLNETGFTEEKNPLNITVYAIFQRQQVTVSVSENVVVLQGTGENVVESNRFWNVMGLSFSFRLNDGSLANSYTYNYTSNKNSGEGVGLSGFNFAMTGSDSVGYYISGYRLLNAEREVATLDGQRIEFKGDKDVNNVSMQFNLYDTLKALFEKGQNRSLKYNYTIVPIIREKTATLVFHSGTGNSGYGDTKNGQVFDTANNNTTESYFVTQEYYYGTTMYLNNALPGYLNASSQTSQIVVEDLFSTRTGYSKNLSNHWVAENGERLNGSMLNLSTVYFRDSATSKQIHFYVVWDANTYEIRFNPNGGIFEGTDVIVIQAVYDSTKIYYKNLEYSSSKLNSIDDLISKLNYIGYENMGWSLDADNNTLGRIVLTNELEYVTGNDYSLFDANGNYIVPDNQNVYAVWLEKTYTIKLMMNGANSYLINGQETIVDIDEQKEYSVDLSLKYNYTFENLFIGDDENNQFKISQIVPTREGYTFLGIFAVSGSRQQQIEDSTIFTTNILSCSSTMTEDVVLTLYVKWGFDYSYLSLTVDQNSLSDLTYNAGQQTVYLAEYFNLGYQGVGYVINIDENGQDMTIALSPNMNSSILVELSSTTATVDFGSLEFKVRNVGSYSATLSLAVYDSTNYLNNGNVYNTTLLFYINVAQANIRYENDTDVSYLQNIKRIMSPFVSEEFNARLQSCSSLSQFTNLMMSEDSTITGQVDQELNLSVYAYIMYKYYNIICYNNGDDYLLYRQWTYADYLDFVSEEANKNAVDETVAKLLYFDFYDYTIDETVTNLDGYESLSLVSDDVMNVGLEVSISRISLLSGSASLMIPNNAYQVRIFLRNVVSTIDSLANYNVMYDSDGNAYINVGTAWLLPQPFLIENLNPTKSAYFEANVENKEVDWVGDRESVQYNGKDFYLIENNIYVSAQIFTSTSGDFLTDTVYSFIDDENYLFFNNVEILLRTSEGDVVKNSLVTSYFKLILAEDDLFTILNTNGVANIIVSAKYLTNQNGGIYFETVENQMASELLRITRVYYNTDGTEKDVYDSDGLDVGSYSDNGVLVYEIMVNNENEVSIFLSPTVTRVVFTATTFDISDYIGLYKWTDTPLYNIDGTMDTQGSMTLEVDSIELSDSGLTELNYYAIYTDLVLVTYNLNFPSSYETTSDTSATIKLGETTARELPIPSENGFTISSLKAKTPSGETLDYTEIFTGEDYGNGPVYVGMTPETRHAPISLDAKWSVVDIEYNQIITDYRTAVNTFTSLNSGSVVSLINRNNDLYEYSYVWYFNNEQVSEGEILTLPEQGSYKESGTYRLVVTATLNPEYAVSLEDPAKTTTSIDIEFTLQFMRNLVSKITVPEAEDLERTYDGLDHINEWPVSIETYVYSTGKDDYNDVATVETLYYVTTGSIYFKVFFNGGEVTTMKNAGEYRITINFDEGFYDVSGVDPSSLEFICTIKALSVDLSDYDFSESKQFNAVEPSLVKELYLANENVSLQLSRSAGEDIGEYDIFFNDNLQEYKANYIFTYGDVVLFENGVLTEQGKVTPIGTFTILKSGTLRLSYEVTALNPMEIETDYSNLGYSLKLTDDFRLQIYNGEVLYKEFYLNLFDIATGDYISSDEILNILKTKINDVQAYFFNTTNYAVAYNSMVYTYSFVLGEEFLKYYTNVEFESGYTFRIKTISVDVSQFKLEKTYDGLSTVYIDLTGNVIDLTNYNGVYIQANFLTAHAGTNIRVDLSLQKTDPAENLANYVLTASYVVGTINKLDATMNLNMSKNTFTYGEISLSNFSTFVDSYTIMSSENQLVTDLLVNGYYIISYSLANPLTNEKGFLYKGNYTIDANAEFQDFNMTINKPSFEVVALQYSRQITENYIQISVLDEVQEYYNDNVFIQNTGDTITLKLAPEGLTAGEKADAGSYNLLLMENTYLNGSIIVSINANNNGFQVLFDTATVYVRLADTSVLTQDYNGQGYSVSADVSKNITVSNGDTDFTSALTFFLKTEENGEVVETALADSEISFNSLAIGFDNSVSQVVDAGQYKLSIIADCNEYLNVIFAEDYILNVRQRLIDNSQFNFEKTYDGIGSYQIVEFNEKVAGDDISILVQYDSAVAGDNKNVNLYLNGTDMNNYALSSYLGIGSIKKAEAIVTLTKTSLTYGEVATNQPLTYTVSSSGKNLLPSQYSLTLEIQNANYSEAGYLLVGNYTVALASQSSTNYSLVLDTTEIQISAYNLNIGFSANGEVSYEYNSPEALSSQFTYIYMTPLYETIEILMTRQSGKDIGYYKILSGVSNDANYNVSNVSDSSQYGAFRVSQAKEKLYLLLSSDQEVLASSGGDTATIQYDGVVYDVVSVEETSEDSGLYKLVFTSSSSINARQEFDLNFYTYDSTRMVYTKTDVTVDGLSTNIKLLNPSTVKNVGTYEIYSSGTTSITYEVKMGKNGSIYSFYLEIAKRELYFLQAEQSKVFDNKDATFEYANANEMLSGIVAGEHISLSMRFTQNGEVVKYVGVNYNVEAEISGETVENYNLNFTDAEGTALNATIYRAEMIFVINSQSYTYGDDFVLQYKYQTDVDLTGYDMSRMSIELTVPDKELYYSTSGVLNVGEYDMILLFSASDFAIGGYMINNQKQDELLAKLTISPRELQLVEKDMSLQDVFTKAYDESNSVNILDNDGNLLFDLSGVHQGEDGTLDVVEVASAHYASANVGQAIQVSFELSGEDSKNYTISPWLYGVIKAIIVGLEFDYRAEGSDVTSNVDANNLQTLSQLSFPFMSTAYLTSNSASSSTNSIKNFPTSLTGRTGYAFLNWTMDFENIENASAELSYLEDVVAKLGLEHTYENSTYSVVVDNGEKTVRFLNELLLDQNNTLGYYYKNSSDLKFTFNANWDTNKYRITIIVADENGNSASYGSVEIDDGNPDTENTVVTTNYLGEFDYDSSITLRPTANAHCYYVGYYTADGKKYIGTEPYISIVREGEKEVFTITNIRQAYNLVVRFGVQKVNVAFDLGDYSDAVVNSKDFVNVGNSVYQWSTDYLTLEDMYISDLPEITRLGYNVVSLSTATTTILKDNFEATKIVSLIPESTETTVSLTLTPNFEAVGVVVTLDYGYDDVSENIVVPYGQSYNSSADWVEEPIRNGYTFAGWFDSMGARVYGDSILSTTEAHTLTAQWTINKYSLELIAENATITNANVIFAVNGSTYSAGEIEYNYKVTFRVTANEGYEISSAWSAGFDVVINEDKTADITLTMPAENMVYTLPILAITNTVTIVGEHLNEIRAYDVTGEEVELVVINNQFEIQTAKIFKLVVSAEVGYVITDTIYGGDGLEISAVVEDGVLTATVEGVSSDTTLTLVAQESKNNISILFDDNDVVETIEIDGKIYNSVDDLPVIQVNTNAVLSFYVKFKHGYGLGSYVCDEFTVSHSYIEDGAYIGNYLFEVSDISTDGSILISSALAKYTLNLEVISYNENKEQVEIAGNVALANGLTSIEAEYNSTVLITYQVAELYSFAGWSKDGENIFSTEARLNYTITQDETIYAIFSTLKFNIEFATYNYYTIYDEYLDANKIENVYTEIPGAKYFDADSGKEISGIELYYGANKNIKYQVPTGFMYYGYGYRDGENFIYLRIDEKIDKEVEVNISSLLLNQDNTDLKIYIVVKAYSLSVEFETKIDIDGVREEDVDVGYIELQDSNENSVNQYGYIDGTRVHYAPEDFENGQVLSNKNFTVVAYTNDVIYIKARILKEGYKFSSIVANRTDITISKLIENEDFVFFEISNLIGGIDSIYIEVLFKPILNVINLSFVNNNLTVDGGSFTFNVAEENANKVWTSGREYSAMVVSAYTDSYFEVVALIRSGYRVNGFDLQINDSANIIVPGSVTYEALSVRDSGYTGKITFMVANYLGVSSITIGVVPLTYTVQLMEDTNILAVIDNVSFNSTLNLTEYNAENITIVDERIYFQNGKLKVDLKKAQYNFEGYFTYQNGAGVQYINSLGNPVNTWQESGYVLNTLTSKYELSENAIIDPDTGKITIKLYLYWSYLKTRINFEFVPAIRTSYTAQDMVSGVDFSNSWFYETAPMYIEVSFNTDIRIVAPTIDGYQFYKFVISQKNSEGTWLTDVVSFSNDIPWSTNEYDRIVECRIQVVYFAKVEVTLFGGEGTFNIYQESSDTQAKLLLQDGYVDTTKEFSIEAVPSEGYSFLRWVNSTTGLSSFNKTMSLTISRKTNLVMNLQGETVTLNFEDYDTTFGQITNLNVSSLDNTYNSYRLGGYSGDEFLKIMTEVEVRVGDKLTFVLNVDFGFGVVWNRDDVTFVEYVGNMYYFTMNVPTDLAGQTVDIVPTFKDEILAVYISRSFVEDDIDENVIDYNNVDMAGYVTYNGEEISYMGFDKGKEIRIITVTSARYEVDKITIQNYNNVFDNMSDFFTEEGVIVLTPEFMEFNNIVGTIEISIEYKRVLWEDEIVVSEFDGSGTSRNPYQIKTVEDLILMMNYVNNGTFAPTGIKYKDSFFILMNDLELNEKFWTPIGTDSNSFNGYFNFNNHKIGGVYTAYFYNPVSYNGLFGVLGTNAKIVENGEVSLWYVYLIIGLVVLMVLLLIILILTNKKRKKRREELSTK